RFEVVQRAPDRRADLVWIAVGANLHGADKWRRRIEREKHHWDRGFAHGIDVRIAHHADDLNVSLVVEAKELAERLTALEILAGGCLVGGRNLRAGGADLTGGEVAAGGDGHAERREVVAADGVHLEHDLLPRLSAVTADHNAIAVRPATVQHAAHRRRRRLNAGNRFDAVENALIKRRQLGGLGTPQHRG